MTVDINPFELNFAFVEVVFMSINVVALDENVEEKVKEDMELDVFKNVEKSIYPKVGEDLLDFLLRQGDANATVTIYPRFSVVFDKNAAKAYGEQKDAKAKREKDRIE